MPDAKKIRVAAKGWLTKASKRLDDLCKDEENVDFVALKDAVDEFDKRVSAWDSAQSEVEQELEETQLEAEIDQASSYREKVRTSRVNAAKILNKQASLPVKKQSNGGSVDSGTTTLPEAKLPKLELPSFSGEVIDWTSFWEQFEAVVHKSELPEITKFTYLRSLLKGEARHAIQGFSLTGPNYTAAVELLHQRFGRKERIIFSHVQQLLNLTAPKQAKMTLLWEFYDKVQTHVRSLETLGISGSQYGVVLTPMILSRLPPDMRLEWAREGESHEGDLDFLLKFLQNEMERKERSQTFAKDAKEGTISHADTLSQDKLPTAASLLSFKETSCTLCGRHNHTIDKCYNVTRIPAEDRKEVLRSVHACFKCLSTQKGHVYRKCAAKCNKCKGRHHSVLCETSQSQPKEAKDDGKGSQNGGGDTGKIDNPGSGLLSVTQTHTHAHDHTLNTCSAPVSDKHVSNVHSVSEKTNQILLQTARVAVQGECGVTEAVVLLDTGSDKTYISESLVSKVRPQWVGSQNLAYATFGSERVSKSQMRNKYSVTLQGSQGNTAAIVATEIPVICPPMFRPAVPDSVLESLGSDIKFVDVAEGQPFNVDLLIGLDHYWKVMTSDIVFLPDGLVAQRSVFGWILSGTVSSAMSVVSTSDTISHQLLCINDLSETTVRSFWDLESIGVIPNAPSTAVDPVLKQFSENVKFVDNRYEVSLPWRSEQVGKQLVGNAKQAETRLAHLNKRFNQDPDLKGKYDDVIQQMVDTGIVEEVPSSELNCDPPVFYMPHRPVVKQSSRTTKVRPVFDASASGHNGVSLNSCLETGPCLLSSLVEILMRFRKWKVAITSDISKAFLQISVRPEDRDVHRFLWKPDGEMLVMRFTRVPFGNRSSPFLLNATIKHHLASYPLARVVQELLHNLYVDDWLTGADSEEEACNLIIDASQIMSEAGMNLTQWSSSSEAVAELLPCDFQDKFVDSDSVKVLGLKWLASGDSFSFDGVQIPEGLCVTKRIVLSFMARLFDPLGFLAPFVMSAKIMFQDLWRLGLEWDVPVPPAIQSKFTKWLIGLQRLREWQVPRSYTSHPWSENQQVELHAFGDAAETAYSACVYLRVQLQDGSWKSSLVVAKARVAPVKRVTIPRLELLGALLCARLLVFTRQALQLPVQAPYCCWTDSKVVLSWIQGDPSRWKSFVANRVVEIQDLTSPALWKHCPGVENPADLMTRGLLADELIQSDLWLNGPQFLQRDVITFDPVRVPSESCSVLDRVQDEAVSKGKGNHAIDGGVILQSNTVTMKPQCVFEVCRWGRFTKAIRVVGWVLRYISCLRAKVQGRKIDHADDLSYKELGVARLTLIKCVQQSEYQTEFESLGKKKQVAKSSSLYKLSPFIDSDGLLRIEGRLQMANLTFEEKHPLILPKSHFSLLLVRHQHNLLKHAGVGTILTSLRNQYWIVGARRLVKAVKRDCVACKRLDATAGSQVMAPLPELRVKQSPPFSVTGLDHGGPLYCCDHGGKKFYILLFTCAVTRAVHLELVDSLSTEVTVLAVRRFIARRGMPSVVMSDNFKGFLAAKDQLLKAYGTDGPDWQFIVPRAPWWGGWWERLIGSMKSALKRVLGRRSLTRIELETTLQEVEACMNSRPLTFVGDELDSESPLTPSHFLIGRPSVFSPGVVTGGEETQPQDLVERQKIRSEMLDQFWSRWSKEYIRNLPTCKGSRKGAVRVGSLVLVRDEATNRLRWPMGVVQNVYPGRDGMVRAVQVKTAKGLFTRPIQKIHDLEIRAHCDSSLPPGTDQVDQITDISSEKCIDSATDALQTQQTHGANADTVNADLNILNGDKGSVTRYGRQIKPPTKMDL